MPQVNFRTSSERLAFIDRAARIRGVSRTEFVLRSSEAAAIEDPERAARHRPRRRGLGRLRRRARRSSGAGPRREGTLRAPAAVGAVEAPEPLAHRHDISRFSSGVPSLDAWLRGKARLNEAKGGARTYVACDGDRVAGFYSLAASSVERRRVSSRVGRGMSGPIPVILLGQLAVDMEYQGRRLGSDLPIDAARRTLAAADAIGARAVVVQAVDGRAKSFYARFRLPAVLGPRAAHADPADVRDRRAVAAVRPAASAATPVVAGNTSGG